MRNKCTSKNMSLPNENVVYFQIKFRLRRMTINFTYTLWPQTRPKSAHNKHIFKPYSNNQNHCLRICLYKSSPIKCMILPKVLMYAMHTLCDCAFNTDSEYESTTYLELRFGLYPRHLAAEVLFTHRMRAHFTISIAYT